MIRISQCSYCVHFIKKSREEMLKLWTCKAFPNGIPEEIRRNRVVHNQPYPGDQGITFQQDPNNKFKLDIEHLAASKKRITGTDNGLPG